MNKHRMGIVAGVASVVVFVLLDAGAALAHCDTLGGPVVKAAKEALEKRDVTPVLKWLKKEDEAEITALFQKTLKVRAMGKEAQELADMYFFETLVRIHRAGEGVAYTGLKPAEAVEPIVALSDKALDSGSVDDLVKKVTGHIEKSIRERFAKAIAAKKEADKSVEAGREFVEAYVVFMHYVEGIHTAVMGAAHEGHGAAAAGEPASHGGGAVVHDGEVKTEKTEASKEKEAKREDHHE